MEVRKIFAEMGIHITGEGNRYTSELHCMGTCDFVMNYAQDKVANWKAEIG